MAFGEYIPISYGQPVNYLQYSILSGQVQGALQQRFDVNTAKLEELVSKVSSIPLLQEDAKKYLGDKVQGALNLVNANLKASAGRGLLSNSVTTELSRYITSAIDDKVKTHMKYAQDIQNFEAGVAKLREKDPKAFAQRNYEYAKYKAGIENYLNGNIDTKLGTLSYQPFTGDPIEKLTDKALKYKQLKGEQTIEIIDENDPSIKTVRKINGLTTEEIIKYVPGILDSDTQQQLVIDGWYEYKGKPEEAKKDFTDMLTTSMEKMTNEITIQKATIESGATKEKKEDAERNKKLLENKYLEFKTKLESINTIPTEEMGYFLKQQQVINTFAQLAGARINDTYEVNDIWKTKEDYRRADAELALREAEAMQKGLKKKADGTYEQGVAPSDIALNPEIDQNVPDLDVYGQVKKAYNDGYNTVVNTTTEAFKNLPEGATKEGYIASMKASGFDYNPKTDDFVKRKGVVASKADASMTAFYKSKMDVESANGASIEAEIVEANIQRLRVAKLLKDAEAKAIKNTPKTELVKVLPGDDKKWSNFLDMEGRRLTVKESKEILIKASNGSGKGILRDSGVTELQIGKYLKDIPESKYILQKNTINISGDSAKNAISSIPAEAMSGEQFDDKKPITVKKDTEQGKLFLTQYQGVDKDGKQKIARAEVPLKGSALARQLEVSIDDNERSLKASDFEKGKPIFASKEHRIYDARLEKKQISNVYKNIDNTVKDANLAMGLKTFTSKQDAIEIFSVKLQQKGFDEKEAGLIASSLVDRVSRKAIRADLIPMSSAWNLKIKGVTKEFTSDVINKEYLHSQQLFPAQFTLYELYNEIIGEYETKETIKERLK